MDNVLKNKKIHFKVETAPTQVKKLHRGTTVKLQGTARTNEKASGKLVTSVLNLDLQLKTFQVL